MPTSMLLTSLCLEIHTALMLTYSFNSRPGYIPPKRPYGFEALQRDVLDFAVRTLVPGGRLAMWMPTASDEDVEFPVPMHPNLEVVSVCVQPFSSCMSS